MADLKASDIREILRLTQTPDVISFAGGLPAPECFPLEEMKVAAARMLEMGGREAMQYSTTEGHPPLRRWIADRMRTVHGVAADPAEVLVTAGSQQGLDLTGKLFLDEGDVVLCESPTYLGALQAFQAYGPRFVEVPTDDDGIDAERLEKILADTKNVKLLYVIPDFQNPTGRTWALERRQRFMEIVSRHGVPVVEDNPYGELRFGGTALPTLKSLDRCGLVIFLGTFSKIFCPGMRVGWLVAARPLFEKYVILKQGADLHTSTASQMQVSTYLELYDIDANILRIRDVYRRRRDAMVAAMEAEFPRRARFTRPQGGLFTWVELPDGTDARNVLAASLAQQVAFVPGGSFFPNGGRENTLRLNYSNMPEERIAEGIARLAGVLRRFVDGCGEEDQQQAV